MLKVTAIIILSVLTISTSFVFAEEINWGNSLNEGLNIAKGQDKPVMVDFYTDWCG